MIKPIEVKDYSVYAPGQYVVIEQYFQSDKSLAGKDMFVGVKFSEYENCEDTRPSGLSKFKMPFGAGTVDVPISNKKLTVEAIDDNRFKVIYEFFNTGSTSNSSGCAANSSPGVLGIAVGYDKKIALSETQKEQDPCRVSNLCWIGTCANIGLLEAEFQASPIIKYFDGSGNGLNGYNLSGTTVLQFEIPGQIGNTYYLSFCSSYAAINQGVSAVGDLSTGNITGGKGFQSRDGSAYYATAEISQITSVSGYIVYSNGCSWQAAKFSLVPNTIDNSDPPLYPVTYGSVDCELTVNETAVNDCCIGVYPGQSVDVKLTMDTDEYNSNIVSNGTYGNYAANFKSAGVCIAETPVSPDSNCTGSVTHSGGVLTHELSIDSSWAGKQIYLNYQWRFSISTPDGVYEDVINKVVLLNVGEETAITLGSFKDSSGSEITDTYCLDDNATITAEITGEEGQDFTVYSDLNISPATGTFGSGATTLTISTQGLEAFGTYCFTVEGEGDVDGSGDNPTDCASQCSQLDISMTMLQSGSTRWVASISVTATGTDIASIVINQELFEGTSGTITYDGINQPAIASVPLWIGIITTTGCFYYAQGFIEALNEVGATNSGISVGCANFEIPYDGSTCQSNNPGIDVSCSGGSMTISGTGSVANTTSDNLDFSGGGTSSTNRFDLATRVIETTDCGTITIHECFNCESEPDWEQIEECEDNNNLSVSWTFDEGTSTLTLTDENDPSSAQTDKTEYSLDGGANWLTYSTPVVVPEGVTEVPIRRIATFTDCDDAVFEELIVLPGSEEACLSSPELEATYNETTDNHKATKQGNVYNVLSDEVFFSTDLGASFEAYTGPVSGNFVIFQRVVKYTNDCEDAIIVKGSAKPIEGVEVNIPPIEVNINESVTVDCCDQSTEFTSNNTVTCNDEE